MAPNLNSYEGHNARPREIPVIVDMKKAVKVPKKHHSNNHKHTNKPVMNFDFWVDSNEMKESNEQYEPSDSTDNIIADAFTMNEFSPATMNDKQMPYKDYKHERTWNSSQNSRKAHHEHKEDFLK